MAKKTSLPGKGKIKTASSKDSIKKKPGEVKKEPAAPAKKVISDFDKSLAVTHSGDGAVLMGSHLIIGRDWEGE